MQNQKENKIVSFLLLISNNTTKTSLLSSPAPIFIPSFSYLSPIRSPQLPPMATPPPQTKHYAINQFLSEVLSQRGPSSLPYTEDTKWLIRQHLLTLASSYPSLDPKTATFTHNDGRTVNLLQADGTVPMAYQSVTYNIPIIIWLIDSYPRHPPLVYVNPTRDMVISSSHPHVNPSGLVSIPYVQNWIYPTSNLVDLARELSHMFSRNPPVYTKSRSNPNPTPNPNPPVPIYHHNHPNPSNFGSAGAYPQRPMVRPPYSPSPYGGGAAAGSIVSSGVTGGGRVGTDDAAEVYRKNAIGKVIDMVHRDVAELRKAREGEMEGLFAAQGALKRREEEINMGLKEMRDEVEALETQLQVVLMNTDVLEGWVRLNESKVKGNMKDMDVDSAFECTDVLSKQMLETTSVDLAIEDVIYSLDKAVQEGAVPFDQYLKNVRLLSREQFFKRALAAKVRAAQMQAQVANMAARAPHYAA